MRERQTNELGGNAESAGAGADRLGLGLRSLLEFGLEKGDPFGRHSVQDGLQNDFHFPEAGIEIVMQRADMAPNDIRLGCDAVGNIRGCFVKLCLEAVDGVGENAQLVEKAGTLSEKDVVEDAVPGRGALRGIAAEVFGSKGLDVGNFGNPAGESGKRLAGKNQQARDAPKEF